MITGSEHILASKPAMLTAAAEAVKPCVDGEHEKRVTKQFFLTNALSKYTPLALATSSIIAQYCSPTPSAWKKIKELKSTTYKQKVINVVSLNPTEVVINTEAGPTMWNVETGKQLVIPSGAQFPTSDPDDLGQKQRFVCKLSDDGSTAGAVRRVGESKDSIRIVVKRKGCHTIPLEHSHALLVHKISADTILVASSDKEDGTEEINYRLYNVKSGMKENEFSVRAGDGSRAMIIGLPGGRFVLATGSGCGGHTTMHEVVRNDKDVNELHKQDLDVQAVRMSKGSSVGYYGEFQSSLFWLSKMLKPMMAIAPDNQPVEVWAEEECAGCKKAIQDLTTDSK